MTTYLRVERHHEHEEEPIVIYSEIADGLETRKVEVYRSGHMDYADENTETGTTQLAEGTVPSLDEIEAQREFSPSEISSEEFEAVWVAATQPGSESGP